VGLGTQAQARPTGALCHNPQRGFSGECEKQRIKGQLGRFRPAKASSIKPIRSKRLTNKKEPHMMPEKQLLQTLRAGAIKGVEHAKLVAKCQENGWLQIGGAAWLDDPYLEEYPYEFARLNNIEDLRAFFAHGNWAIRQGVVFDDLAFIQQVDGGDEWWTLKNNNGEWMDFESIGFEDVAIGKNDKDFMTLIRSMQLASPYECKKLIYFDEHAPERYVELHAAKENMSNLTPLATRAEHAKAAAQNMTHPPHEAHIPALEK
jgi:hypothetical protein